MSVALTDAELAELGIKSIVSRDFKFDPSGRNPEITSSLSSMFEGILSDVNQFKNTDVRILVITVPFDNPDFEAPKVSFEITGATYADDSYINAAILIMSGALYRLPKKLHEIKVRVYHDSDYQTAVVPRRRTYLMG